MAVAACMRLTNETCEMRPGGVLSWRHCRHGGGCMDAAGIETIKETSTDWQQCSHVPQCVC